MTYTVTFRKQFGEDGAGIDSPTDFFHVPDGVVENMNFIDMRHPANGSEYGEEEWQYDVDQAHTCAFEAACDRCKTVIAYKNIDASEAPGGTHRHTCLGCGTLIGYGDDCERDTDHDFGMCDGCGNAH